MNLRDTYFNDPIFWEPPYQDTDYVDLTRAEREERLPENKEPIQTESTEAWDKDATHQS